MTNKIPIPAISNLFIQIICKPSWIVSSREKEGKLLPPKSGLFVIAAEAGVDVVPCRILYDTPDGRMHLFCKVRVIYGEPMPAMQFAMEGRRDTKKLRANKQALLEAWEKMGA